MLISQFFFCWKGWPNNFKRRFRLNYIFPKLFSLLMNPIIVGHPARLCAGGLRGAGHPGPLPQQDTVIQQRCLQEHNSLKVS